MPSPTPEDWNYWARLIGSQWTANWKYEDSDLEGLDGEAFPLVGAAVADAPRSAGTSPQRPLEGGSALGFAVILARFLRNASRDDASEADLEEGLAP